MITLITMTQFGESSVVVGEFRRQYGTENFALKMGEIELTAFLDGQRPGLIENGSLSVETLVSLVENAPDHWVFKVYGKGGEKRIQELFLDLSLSEMREMAYA